MTTSKEKFESRKLPMMPIRDVVIFPHMTTPFVVGRESSMRALEEALAADKKTFVATQHDASVDEPKANEIYQVGTIANIVQSIKLPDGNIKVIVEGVERGKILQVTDKKGYFQANIRTVKYTPEITPAIESAMQVVNSLFEQYVKLFRSLNYGPMIAAVRMEDPAKLTDTIAANLQLSIEEKQELLEIFDPAERLNRIADVLDIEIEKLNMDRTIESRAKRQMEREQKEHYLNEKITAIEKELGRGRLTGQSVGLKLADGNVIQGKLASTDANGVWLDVDKSSWVALAGPKGQVQHPFEKHTGTLRFFVPFSSMAWLMTESETNISVFHKFSSRAMRVVFLARKDAGERGAAAMDVPHLLAAVVREDQGEFANLVPGLSLEGQEELRPARPFFSPDAATAILASVEQLLAAEAKSAPESRDMPFSPALEHTFNAAVDLVSELHQVRVEPLHLLAAMLVGESTSATDILKRMGITRDVVLAAIQTLLLPGS